MTIVILLETRFWFSSSSIPYAYSVEPRLSSMTELRLSIVFPSIRCTKATIWDHIFDIYIYIHIYVYKDSHFTCVCHLVATNPGFIYTNIVINTQKLFSYKHYKIVWLIHMTMCKCLHSTVSYTITRKTKNIFFPLVSLLSNTARHRQSIENFGPWYIPPRNHTVIHKHIQTASNEHT